MDKFERKLDQAAAIRDRYGLDYCDVVPAEPDAPDGAAYYLAAAGAERISRLVARSEPLALSLGTGRSVRATGRPRAAMTARGTVSSRCSATWHVTAPPTAMTAWWRWPTRPAASASCCRPRWWPTRWRRSRPCSASGSSRPSRNPSESQVADRPGFAQAPLAETPKDSHWLWSWALAIPASSEKQESAREFITWATSWEYIELVGETEGWISAPPGTRESTYASENYQEAAPFADFALEAIQSADPIDSTLEPSPYIGVQFVGIPEFQSIGTQVGQMVAAALTVT